MAPRRSSRLQNKDSIEIQEVTSITQNTNSINRTTNRQKRKKNTSTRNQNGRKSAKKTRSTSRAAPKPVVINLDVTYSESSDESEIEELSVLPSKNSDIQHNKTARQRDFLVSILDPDANKRNTRCSLSDSDEDILPDFCPKKSSEKNGNSNGDLSSDSDSETEIYKVDYKAERWKAFEVVENEIKSMATMKDTNCDLVKKNDKTTRSKNSKYDDDSFSTLNDTDNCIDTNLNGEENTDSMMNSSLDLSIDVSSIVLKGSAKAVRRPNKKTKNALASLQAFTKRLEEDSKINNKLGNDSYLDDDDDVIIAEDSTISIRVCWGTSYTRHVLKKHGKFSSLYQEIADKNNVSVSQVVLSFKDTVISPESRPSELKLSIGDILEGGIVKNSDKTSNSESTEKAEGEILLKVQTSNRKIVHTVAMSKYDKMSVLMDKYSKLRGIPLTKLKFKFDGETLEPSDTPSFLDLEGDECIDVFEL